MEELEKSPAEGVDRLQREDHTKIRETYGEGVFSRWQNPKFMERMVDASCVGKITGKCGDTIEIYLRIVDERIRQASFFTDGCACAVACGSTVVELATGKDIDEAAGIGGDTILEILGGLPEEERHCAFLAAETLMAAIHEWMIRSHG